MYIFENIASIIFKKPRFVKQILKFFAFRILSTASAIFCTSLWIISLLFIHNLLITCGQNFLFLCICIFPTFIFSLFYPVFSCVHSLDEIIHSPRTSPPVFRSYVNSFYAYPHRTNLFLIFIHKIRPVLHILFKSFHCENYLFGLILP